MKIKTFLNPNELVTFKVSQKKLNLFESVYPVHVVVLN